MKVSVHLGLAAIVSLYIAGGIKSLLPNENRKMMATSTNSQWIFFSLNVVKLRDLEKHKKRMLMRPMRLANYRKTPNSFEAVNRFRKIE